MITVVLSPKPICILYILFLIYLFNAHLLHKNVNSVRAGFPLHLSLIHCYIPKVSNLIVCVLSQSCPTLCEPIDCSPPGSSVHGIPQARILEWVAIALSRGSSRPRDRM